MSAFPSASNVVTPEFKSSVPVDEVTALCQAPEAPRDGAKTANAWSLVEPLILQDNVIISGLYPPSPKTLTTVTEPAERKYCCMVYGV